MSCPHCGMNSSREPYWSSGGDQDFLGLIASKTSLWGDGGLVVKMSFQMQASEKGFCVSLGLCINLGLYISLGNQPTRVIY